MGRRGLRRRRCVEPHSGCVTGTQEAQIVCWLVASPIPRRWLVSKTLKRMVRSLKDIASDRKIRLFVVACCWCDSSNQGGGGYGGGGEEWVRIHQSYAVAEAFADGIATVEELRQHWIHDP